MREYDWFLSAHDTRELRDSYYDRDFSHVHPAIYLSIYPSVCPSMYLPMHSLSRHVLRSYSVLLYTTGARNTRKNLTWTLTSKSLRSNHKPLSSHKGRDIEDSERTGERHRVRGDDAKSSRNQGEGTGSWNSIVQPRNCKFLNRTDTQNEKIKFHKK
jgi:hypothetical protein